MERHKRIVAASLAVALLLAACSDGDGAAEGVQPIEEPQADPGEPEPDPVDEDPEPEVEPAPDAEPEPADIDITVVPDEITEEYVEAVFIELERIYAEALIEMRRNNDELNIEVTDRLGEIFEGGDALTQNIEIFENSGAGGFLDIRGIDDIEPRIRRVIAIISASADCVFVETSADASPMVMNAESQNVNFVQLVPKVVERPVVLNRSQWIYARVTTPFDPSDRIDIAENDPCKS